jgi:hypothetical protein
MHREPITFYLGLYGSTDTYQVMQDSTYTDVTYVEVPKTHF